MRAAATLLLLFLFLIPAHGQEILGIGLVKIRVNDKPLIDFYRKPTDELFRQRIRFYRDSISKGVKIQDFDEVSRWLNPELLWLDDFQFTFRCKSARDGWFEVVVNNENGHTFWIRNDRSTQFVSWENYLREMLSISRTPYYKQKIRTQADDKADEILYQGQDCFQVKSLRKDWVEIFTPPTCPPDIQKLISGWIKWRKGNKLLIDY